jgi:hypothetical protein
MQADDLCVVLADPESKLQSPIGDVGAVEPYPDPRHEKHSGENARTPFF